MLVILLLFILKNSILKYLKRKNEAEARAQQFRNEQEAILLQIQKGQFRMIFSDSFGDTLQCIRYNGASQNPDLGWKAINRTDTGSSKDCSTSISKEPKKLTWFNRLT